MRTKNMPHFNIITFIVIISPILNVYATPIQGLGFGNLILILCFPYLLIKTLNNRNHYLKKFSWLFIFYFYSIVITFLNIFAFGYSLRDGFVRLLVESFYIFMILAVSASGCFNFQKGFRYYRFVALVVAAIIIIQTFAFYLFSKNLYFLIPTLKYNQSTLSTYSQYVKTYDYMYLYWFRPTSLFLEPSHAALFLCPFLLLCLLKNDVKVRDVCVSGFITASVVLTTSGTGILACFVIWLIFLLKCILHKNRIIIPVLLLVIISVGILFLFDSRIHVFKKIINLITSRINSLETASSSSINVRLFKGFEFYKILSPFEKFFGMGMGTYDSYIVQNNLDKTTFSYEYMNSISYILCSSGVVGFVLFIFSIFCFYKYSNSSHKKELLILILIYYLTGSTLFGAYDFLPYVFLLSPIAASRFKKPNKQIVLSQNLNNRGSPIFCKRY